ncbi:unnamed protein product [Gongylonema pulchrum]|uniref:TMEM135_C_rich domain-containing protein n=1 Tax=Gongylonema pulchrum TaxID=637853 RepID=A0A183DQT3_9BILA|nr:unnamed protein product [Gongylonema pulchrum]
MALLSKFLTEKLGLRVHRATCHEMIHTWNASCYGAIADTLRDTSLFAFKTYLLFYSLAGIVSVRDIREIRWRTIIINTLRSASFLTVNVAAFLWLMCRMRLLLGCFTVPTLGLVNGIIASMFAILIENPRRRANLALYLSNLLVSHGYLKHLPNGAAIIFGIGIAGLFCLLRRGKLDASTKHSVEYALLLDESCELLPHPTLCKISYGVGDALFRLRHMYMKHPLCQHNYSCLSRIVEAFCKNFFKGLIWSVCITLLNSGFAVVRRPFAFIFLLLSFRTLRLPLFYGSLASLCQVVRCGDRYLALRQSAPAYLYGIASAFAMLVYSNCSVALFVFWKYALLLDESCELLPHPTLCKISYGVGDALFRLRHMYMKHPLCQHNYSCLSRIVEAFCKNFFKGLIWSVCITLLNSGFAVVRRPFAFIFLLLSFRTLRLPLFYGSLASLCQVVRCGDRYLALRQSAPAYLYGIASAFAMLVYSNCSVALFVFWKFIEASYFAYCKGLAVPYGDVLLYALSTGFVAWNATVEPHTLRKAYWKFLVGLTGRRIELLNRRLFDHFGYRSSEKFSNFVPKLLTLRTVKDLQCHMVTYFCMPYRQVSWHGMQRSNLILFGKPTGNFSLDLLEEG